MVVCRKHHFVVGRVWNFLSPQCQTPHLSDVWLRHPKRLAEKSALSLFQKPNYSAQSKCLKPVSLHPHYTWSQAGLVQSMISARCSSHCLEALFRSGQTLSLYLNSMLQVLSARHLDSIQLSFTFLWGLYWCFSSFLRSKWCIHLFMGWTGTEFVEWCLILVSASPHAWTTDRE